jgi:hypothetical protein
LLVESMVTKGEAAPAAGEDHSTGPAAGSRPPQAAASDVALRLRSFHAELRVTGPGVFEKSVDLKPPAGSSWFVAIDGVEVCVARGEAPAAQGAISSATVQAGMRGDQLVCVANLSDYAPEDLLVIRVTGKIIAIG